MEKTLKRKLIEAADTIKKKVKMIRDLETDNETALQEVFKPISDPLKQMVKSKNVENENMNRDNNNIHNYNADMDSYLDKTFKKHSLGDEGFDDNKWSENFTNDNYDDENKSVNTNSSENEDVNDTSFQTVMSEPQGETSSWSLSSENLKDVPFGVRHERGKLKMGSCNVAVTDEFITVAGQKYETTPGLVELLFKKNPNLNIITKDDTTNYKKMLLDTNAHRQGFDPKRPIKSNKGKKYMQVIKPLFKFRHDSVSTESSLSKGKGLPELKKLKKNVDFVYWNDPNELVNRLKLLLASRSAGNTGLDNDIISIIEELHESGVLSE